MKTGQFVIRFLLINFGLYMACNNNNPTVTNKFDTGKIKTSDEDEINIVLSKTLAQQASNSIKKVNVEYDQYFKSPKKYLGFPLVPLLDSTWKAARFDTTNAIIIFECKDGYNPMMPISNIYGPTKSYIAVKDMDQPDNQEWPDSLSQKFRPYYLVWDKVKKDDKSFSWPYGLTSIRLISQNGKLHSIAPNPDSPAQQGYITFRNNCIKCHSINKIGGTMGPEFNIPKNITEYRDEKQIISFAKAPTSYRYNSHMPAMTNLSDNDFANIILYLKYMKDHKK